MALNFHPILIQRLHELQSRFRLVLLPQEILDVTIKLGIDRRLLIALIKEARTYKLPKNAEKEGADIFVPVTKLTDIYKLATEENKIRTYVLKFKRENGILVFVAIEEQKI